jgi:hypothetical protein
MKNPALANMSVHLHTKPSNIVKLPEASSKACNEANMIHGDELPSLFRR